MAGKRKSPLWRRVFLRALARTGNVSVSAAEAGVEPETAHRHRRKDERFAGQWAAALARGKAAAEKVGAGRRSRSAGELVLLRTRGGAKLVRAVPGRWCARAEADFFAELGRTGCVRSAVAASGLSVQALYYRRDHYPAFAERWRAVEAAAAERLPALLRAASIASLDPDVADEGLPRIDVDQAIRISQLKGGAEAGRGRKGGRNLYRKPEPTREEMIASIMKMLDVVDKRDRRAKLGEGWSETESGVLVPPGWVQGASDGEAEGEAAGGGAGEG